MENITINKKRKYNNIDNDLFIDNIKIIINEINKDEYEVIIKITELNSLNHVKKQKF